MKPIKMSAVITINFLFIFIFIVSGCEKKNTRTELGFVPSEITWEENEYYATDTILGQKDVGKHLGNGTYQDMNRSVYIIIGKDPRKSIAVKAIGPHYIIFISNNK